MARGYPDFEGNKSGLYSKAEWAAFEGSDRNITGTSLVLPAAATALISYTPPATQTFYISHFGCNLISGAGNVALYIQESPIIVYLAVAGGAQGCFASLNKPIVVAGGQMVRMVAYHFGLGALTLAGHIGGYLI